jgi:hypothetical protein
MHEALYSVRGTAYASALAIATTSTAKKARRKIRTARERL